MKKNKNDQIFLNAAGSCNSIKIAMTSSRTIPVLKIYEWVENEKIKINWENTPTPIREVISREKIENKFSCHQVALDSEDLKDFSQKKSRQTVFILPFLFLNFSQKVAESLTCLYLGY